MSKPVALITGAGRRLGLHMTRSFLNRGWRVIALTRSNLGELAQLQSSNLQVLTVNALSEKSVAGVIKDIKSKYEHIDFVLHNASIYEKDEAHSDDMIGFYDSLYKIHMRFPAQLNHGLEQLLKNTVRDSANVIHVTDIYVANPNADYALYCSTKAGLENLMLSFAKRFAPRVRVNAIRPGPVKFLPEHSSEEQSKVLDETLLAVEGGFEALEKAIYSILDNEYVTASVVTVDGGRSVAK